MYNNPRSKPTVTNQTVTKPTTQNDEIQSDKKNNLNRKLERCEAKNKIEKTKLQQELQADYEKIFNLILDYTKFYKRKQIKTILKATIEKWKESRKQGPNYDKIQLKVVIPIRGDSTPGSREYYYAEFKNILPSHKVVTEVSIVNEYIEYLFLDDWIMNFQIIRGELESSGIRGCSLIHKTLENVNPEILKVEQYIKKPIFTFITALYFENINNLIKTELNNDTSKPNVFFYTSIGNEGNNYPEIIYPLKYYIDNYNKDNTNISEKAITEFNNYYTNTNNLGLVYLDYKIPNDVPRYNDLYTSCTSSTYENVLNNLANPGQFIKGVFNRN